ncbi:MAG: hypothetical protein ACK4S4_01495 [Pyrinomonadaceae bacterium]
MNYTRTDLESPAANQTDVPRFTVMRDWAENFNQDSGGTAQERVFTNTAPTTVSYNSPAGFSMTAAKIEVSMQGDPYNSVTRTYLGASGWQQGLPVATEDWANGAGGSELKRWTWAEWTQDDTNLAYILNPRTTETRVGDNANVKRTTYEYCAEPIDCSQHSAYGLVSAVKVYDADLSTVIKKVHTTYNLTAPYPSRRIIGLPSMVEAWGKNDLTGSLEYVSKVTYGYDEFAFNDSTLAQSISPTQHDNTNYGASFVTGRGLLTSTTRHDVLGQSSAVTSQTKYNTAGAPVAQISPWDGTNTRSVKIGYADSFNDGNNVRGTFAYPTTLTDPAGNSSTVKYRFDIGANVEATSPAPAGNAYGKKTARTFDAVGRLIRDAVILGSVEYAYTRYEYPQNGIQSKVFSTLVDTNNNNRGDSADEVVSESWSDGAGRVRRARNEHPGSTGGWAATLTDYDILGRVLRSSVPTEVNANWNPAGDDATRGFLWTSQKYDWKDRVVRKINTDGNPDLAENDSDIFFDYQGCGCAGGQVTTIRSERVPRDDQSNTYARRTQRIYEDILGRSFKTIVYKWDGTTRSDDGK